MGLEELWRGARRLYRAVHGSVLPLIHRRRSKNYLRMCGRRGLRMLAAVD